MLEFQRWLRSEIVLFLLLAVMGCTSSGFSPLGRLEQSLVYMPVGYPIGRWFQQIGTEDAWFASADGTKLHGWYLPHPTPRAVVLYAHGNAGNLTFFADEARQLNARHECSVLIFDYRGYGRSEGTPSEEGLVADARAARRWLAARAGVTEADIVLVGRSLGGGVMVDLAAKDGARGLVLINTFTSLPDVGAHHMPLASPQVLMRNRYDSLTKIPSYHGPLLETHGDADRVVPYPQGQQLFAAANEPKRFIAVPGGGHNDPVTEEFHTALDDFVARLPIPGVAVAR